MLTRQLQFSTPRTIRDTTVTDPFRSPIVEVDSDEDQDGDEDSIFGGSLEDALAAIALVAGDNDDYLSDSDIEIVSPTLYDSTSTPTSSSDASLPLVIEGDGDDKGSAADNSDSEISENVEDISVVDHITHIVTRTLIRPSKPRRRNPLGFFTSLVSTLR